MLVCSEGGRVGGFGRYLAGSVTCAAVMVSARSMSRPEPGSLMLVGAGGC